jgi:hypothetical protein
VPSLGGREAKRLRMTFSGRHATGRLGRLRGPTRTCSSSRNGTFRPAAAESAKLPNFTLLRSTSVESVVRDPAATGVRTGKGTRSGHADGRPTPLLDRTRSARPVPRSSARRWTPLFRLPRHEGDGEGSDFTIGHGGLMICIDRGSYHQCAPATAGGYAPWWRKGPGPRSRIARLAPFADRVDQRSGTT